MNSDTASPTPRANSKRTVAWIAGIAVLLLLLWAGATAWQRMRAQADSAAQQQRLQAAIERGRTLSAELAAIKPPNAPECPPGQSLKTFAPESVLPGAPVLPASAASGATAAPAAASAGKLAAGAAPVLPDYALAQRLESVTAMVLVDDGNTMSAGTGFFITPNLVVTNRHVVELPNGRMMLVSRALGTARRATLLQVTKGTEMGAPDFALLRMEDGTAPGVLDVAPEVGKLAPVVAAGYPAVVFKGDPNFQRLMRGDASAAPDLSLTQGAVQSLQTRAVGTPLLIHTASISQGNSGGPLVDACGRLVGVNTFISVDQGQSSKLNFALSSQSMASFLSAAGASARTDARPCGLRQ